MKRLPRWQAWAGAVLLLLLGLLFVPECDDCYFVFWDFASWKDFLLTRPITQGALVVGVPTNGRYLGNLLGVIQGKLYFTPLWLLRGLLLGGALLAVVLLLARRFDRQAVGRGEGLSLAFALTMLAPRGLWQQVYSWGAGLVNYLLPMAGILLLLDWLEEDRKKRVSPGLLALTAFACCLFMEPVTILMAVGGTVLAGQAVLLRKRRGEGLAAALGCWLGALTMFSAVGYGQVGSDARRLGLELARSNLSAVLTQTLVRPAPVALLISALLFFLLWRQGGRCPWLWGALLIPVHLACLADFWLDLFRTGERYTAARGALGCVLALLWLGMLAQWRGGADRRQVLLLAGALCVLNGPLLFVSPVGPRNFYPGYVLLLLTAAVLYGAARRAGLRPLAWLRIPGALAGVLLLLVYGCNAVVYHQRLDSARTQVEQGAVSVSLPLLPFSGWAVNELPGKGDISYLVYRNTPWDVSFTFVPWEEFSPE